jgi:predicted dithiol-disulfide oxidoreductase (DUF899 family)
MLLQSGGRGLTDIKNRSSHAGQASPKPFADIQRFRQRMGWQFNWVSSHGSDFNREFGVSFTQEELEHQERFEPAPEAKAAPVACEHCKA